MPRRQQVTCPELEVNSKFIAHFEDGSHIIIKRDIYGYHVVGGYPKFDCKTSTELDEKFSIMAEDRVGVRFA